MATPRAKRPQKVGNSATARSVTIRLPAKVIAHFQEEGAGYQTRICKALEEHIERERQFRSFERACSKLERLSPADRKALAATMKRRLNSDSIRDPFGAISD
jgi:DNA-binding SARP family transcriptional activator